MTSTDQAQPDDHDAVSRPPAAAGKARTLDGWVGAITENELPLFAQNLSEISSVASARQTSAADLARAITMDISMSVRLLRIANSPVLNPQDRAIDSVRAAVVLMGFDAVRDLAFSLSLVNELHRAGDGGRVVALLAHAFHAATLAQVLARAGGDRCPEEVFVAGLLLNIGEMAFWSRDRPESVEIEHRLVDGADAAKAEHDVLGFELRELSRRLAEEWRMSGLLRATLSGRRDDDRCDSVRRADAMAALVESEGWESEPAKAALDDAAERLKLARSDLEAQLREGTRAAARLAGRFGVPSIERFLAPRPGRASASALDPAAPGPTPGSTVSWADPNPQAELEAVRALQTELQGKPDVDRLMHLALDGLHRGAAIDRVFFATLSPDGVWLQARYAAGRDSATLLRDCRIRVDGEGRNLFGILLQTRKAVWVDAERRERLGTLIGPDIDAWARGAPFLAMPVLVRDRAVGLLYGDRSASSRILDDATFTSFRYFGEQIASGLARRGTVS